MLTDNEIEKKILACGGKDIIYDIYKNERLKTRHIDLALDKCHDYLAVLYQHQKMNPSQITKAIRIGINNETIYAHQKLNQENMREAIDHELNNGSDITKQTLFEKELTEDQIGYIVKKSDSETLTIFCSGMQKTKQKPKKTKWVEKAFFKL